MKTDNEIIAEFMGWKKDNQGFWIGCKNGAHHRLTFDASWNELMPVVEKISKMPTGDDDTFYPRTFGMTDADGHPMFRFNRHPLYTADTLIEAAHTAVVEFIKMEHKP